MSSLADFVSEHRNKSSSSRNSFNMANIGTKISSSFNTFFKVDVSDDRETLTDVPSINGQLPPSRNRRVGSSFNIFSTDSQACGLSRMQRIIIFFLFLLGSFVCFVTAMMLLPVLVAQTRKFAALNTLGSVFFIMSFGFLLSPLPYLQFLFSPQRRVVTITYFFSIVITLYTSLWLHISILTILSFCIQMAALFWYLLTYIPGGENGLKFLAKLSASICSFSGSVTGQSASSKLVLPI